MWRTDSNGVDWLITGPSPKDGRWTAKASPVGSRRYAPAPPDISTLTQAIAGNAIDAYAATHRANVIGPPLGLGADVPWFVWLGLAWLVVKGKR